MQKEDAVVKGFVTNDNCFLFIFLKPSLHTIGSGTYPNSHMETAASSTVAQNSELPTLTKNAN